MSLHDEEMKKRREKREAQRRRQEAERRRMKRNLVLAVLLLALGGVGIWFLTRNAGIWGVSAPDPEQPAAPAQTQAATEPEKTSPLLQDPITKIHIRAAGDLNITDSVIQAGLAATGYDFSRAFQDVASTLSDADLTVMSFEGNIFGEPYGTATTSAPPEILKSLRAAGVDLLQVANSSIINNGLNGLTSTLRAIREAGMEPVGAFSNTQELRTSKGYTITEVQGIKVAFVGFTKGLGGRGMPAGNEDLVNLLYEDYDSTYQKIDKERIQKILKNVEAEKPDITIALLHWGSEYNDAISGTQESIVSLMRKGGVDVILGTHPHTLQSIDYDPIQGTLVAYSLGDFFGDAERGATNYSIILDLEITKDASTGTTKVTDYSYTPIYTAKYGEVNGYQKGERRVVRIDSAIQAFGPDLGPDPGDKRTKGLFLDSVTLTTRDSMKYALQRIEERKLTIEEQEAIKEAEKAAKGQGKKK